VDGHVHLVSDDVVRYPLRPTALPGDAWYRHSPVAATRFREEMAAAGVSRAVLVQPVSAYSDDNRYAADTGASDPRRYAAVCAVDPHAADPGRDLRRWAAAGVRGVRLFAVGAGAAPIDGPEFAPLWAAAAELGMTTVVTVLPDQLDGLRRAAEQAPAVPVVLDHCGFAAHDDPALLGLADLPGMHLKITTHVLDQAGKAAGGAAGPGAAGAVASLAACFGPQRLLWGSDYPQIHDRPYAELVAAGRASCARLSAAARACVLWETATRLFWPPPIPPPQR
jgi:predicted TIM-barrel fold metal-dependent hydrolase